MQKRLVNVVLVGRPNVGKSTLFNRLTRTRRAIVTAIPGTTRDVLSQQVEWEGISFQLTDTGGMFGASEDPLHALVLERGRRAIDDDWIVQRVVRQCDVLAAFNTESANTLRIMTYHSTTGLRHVSSVLRMGRSGSRVDNRSTGGVTCGIDAGVLRPTGHLGYEQIKMHPDSGIAFAGFRVPAWREAVDACLEGHEAIPAMDLVSWDVAIDAEERPTLIELNVVEQGLRIHQLENGPLPPDIVAEWAERARFWMVGGLVIRRPLGDSSW